LAALITGIELFDERVIFSSDPIESTLIEGRIQTPAKFFCLLFDTLKYLVNPCRLIYMAVLFSSG